MKDDLDQLIDGALATYANAEPLAGLEQRVVTRARATQSPRRWWWLAALVPVAAVLLVMVAPGPKPARPTPIAEIEPLPTPVEPVREAAAPLHKIPRHVQHRTEPPKRRTFPTISPITEQERLVVDLAQSHPEQLLYRPPDQIEIKPIEIAPLDIDGSQ